MNDDRCSFWGHSTYIYLQDQNNQKVKIYSKLKSLRFLMFLRLWVRLGGQLNVCGHKTIELDLVFGNLPWTPSLSLDNLNKDLPNLV